MYVASLLIILSDLCHVQALDGILENKICETAHPLKPVFFFLSTEKRTALIYTSAAVAVQTLAMVHVY